MFTFPDTIRESYQGSGFPTLYGVAAGTEVAL